MGQLRISEVAVLEVFLPAGNVNCFVVAPRNSSVKPNKLDIFSPVHSKSMNVNIKTLNPQTNWGRFLLKSLPGFETWFEMPKVRSRIKIFFSLV